MKQAASVNRLAQILSWAIVAIFILIPFHAFFTTWLGLNLSHLDLIRIWKDILIVLMFPFLLFLTLTQNGLIAKLVKSWAVRLIIAYALLTFGLGVWAYAKHGVTQSALIYALIINLRFLYFFVLCLVVSYASGALLRNWQRFILWPAALVIFFGLIQKLFLPYDFLKHFGYSSQVIPAYQAVDANLDYTRVQSTLRGANPLGAYLVVIIPFILTALKQKIAKYVLVLLAIITLFFTYSRSAYVGLVLASASLAWIRTKRVSAYLVFIGLFILVVSSGLYLELRSSQTVQDVLLHTSSSSKAAASSNQVRNDALRQGVKDIINDPVGNGPGTAGPASFRNIGHSARISENYYLQIGQEVGVLCMGLFIAIINVIAHALWVNRQDELAQILLSSLIGISFICLVSHAWADDTLAYVWWGLAGIYLSPVILTDRHKQKNAKKIQSA